MRSLHGDCSVDGVEDTEALAPKVKAESADIAASSAPAVPVEECKVINLLSD